MITIYRSETRKDWTRSLNYLLDSEPRRRGCTILLPLLKVQAVDSVHLLYKV